MFKMYTYFQFSILFLIFLQIKQAHCAVKLNITLTDSKIELECSYTLSKTNKFVSLSYLKEGQTFANYASTTDKSNLDI